LKAFVIDRYSKTDPMRLADLPEPQLQDDDVLIEIHAASVNPLDVKIKAGDFKRLLPKRFPLVLGHDVAGIVTRAGSRVQSFKVGDAVFARPSDRRIGTFAEAIAVSARDVAPKPASLSMQEAASLPLVGLTAWQALLERAGVRKGHKVFLQAGSGGVGSIAIQLAKHLGATVATTTSTANVDLVKGLGADVVVDYKTQDFANVLRDYDVVLHSGDKSALEKSIRVLRQGGKLISISGPPDPAFGRQGGWLLEQICRVLSHGIRKKAKQRGVDYSFLFMRPDGAQLHQIGALVDAGVIRPMIDRVFPFATANEALALVDSGRAKGKVVVAVK
jgi:alcohol dehydrogenase